MKVMTILGTRPEIIRLSRVIEKLDALCDHVLVHTGQNYDHSLTGVFFEELGIRAPDHVLGVRSATFGAQIGKILSESEKVLADHRPDRLLLLGDTNSGLSAVVAKRMGIPVFHMEAGNRCYDDRVPEEVNRRVIDHSSDVLMPYTERSRANLLREGIAGERIFVIGNPILEVIRHHEDEIGRSDVLARLGLEPQGYFLVTLHREENVDVEQRLLSVVDALGLLEREHGLPIVVSTHPRTRNRMTRYGLRPDSALLRFPEPFGLFDFIALERSAACVLSDSGTVQEECCIFRIPNVTLRDVTERPETLECGSNILSGAEPDTIAGAVRVVLEQPPTWRIPPEYLVEDVSATTAKLVVGRHEGRGEPRLRPAHDAALRVGEPPHAA
ncbi:MAG TPA: UDP-N-acetylglucosamine 2-epimerase (non-hydrolyzing) [Solirubrobacteraceae bacterium]|nr:UDP-N-acetylglucosamine 2-epimerase (non-hydrolyzing) [Solirubrobacteraceae bacterium]